MILQINFKENLSTDLLLKTVKIPCHCEVSKNFQVMFDRPVEKISGEMLNWDINKFRARAPALGGGAKEYNQPALITLRRKDLSTYYVVHLEFYVNVAGWCTIIEYGEYAVLE